MRALLLACAAALVLGCGSLHHPADAGPDAGDPCGDCRGWVARDAGQRIPHDWCDDHELLARLGCFLDAG